MKHVDQNIDVNFPHFKHVTLSDRFFFEAHTRQFKPLSDYNFFSLWAYNTQDDLSFSLLNKNLVLKMRDYTTDEPFFSFLGVHKLQNTIQTLIEHARHNNFEEKFSLIGEEVVEACSPSIKKTIQFEEDSANHDYVLSINQIRTLAGEKYHNKRHMVNLFTRTHQDVSIVNLDFSDPFVNREVIHIFDQWAKGKNKTKKERAHESIPIHRMLRYADSFDLIGIGLVKQGRLIGFAVAEKIDSEFAVFHFVKAVPGYVGIFDVLYAQIAQALHEKNCRLLNIEQDFALPGLRHAKQQWNPVSYIKKYTIAPRISSNTELN